MKALLIDGTGTISSASANHTPPPNLADTESTPLYTPNWQYSRNKIACESVWPCRS